MYFEILAEFNRRIVVVECCLATRTTASTFEANILESIAALADGKSKAKDSPRDTSSGGGTAAYNHYSTSIRIGTVVITLNSDGSVATTIEWAEPNIDNSAAS